ncbi:CPEB2 [Cordylochernes scorpioides]|uniref:CPEB2 n=1 Tax=Cordylochernes scorpioides TaxID=51811 RepID=A0ABY6KHT6_9ARAC|nr:CPEB2 [Cordylochernes scorpioides]
MGDYNFSVAPNVRALSPVDFQQNSNSASLFFQPEAVSHTMQDDLLLEKGTSKQQLSPNSEGTTNGEQSIDSFTPLKSKVEDSVPVLNGQNDKKTIEITTSGNSSSPLELAFTETLSTPIPTSTLNYWSTVASDDFTQGIQTLNGTLSFQNFPSSTNISPIFSSNLGPQINIPQQPQRRAITGAHNYGQNRQQPNLFKTYTNWSTPHQTTWSSPQTPNAVSSWNNINQSNQKRSVPNLNPISPLKKNPPAIGQHSMVSISPSKFRRSTSLPLGKPFPHGLGTNSSYDMTGTEECRDGNLILPFQKIIPFN